MSEEDTTREQQQTAIQRRMDYNRMAAEKGWPYWRVIVRIEGKGGEQIYGAHAPHRAAAKQWVRDQLETAVTEWVDTYQPRASWDCPNCRTHEAMSTVPNLRGKWDWRCSLCSYRTIGHPQDPEETAGEGSEGW